MPVNAFNQIIGEPLPDYTPGQFPDINILKGKTVTLEHLEMSKHLDDILDFCFTNAQPADWTYLPVGPFHSKEAVIDWLLNVTAINNAYFFAIRDMKTNKISGLFSLMSIVPSARTIEMGYVIYSADLQKSVAATEAQYLAMHYVFEELGYRRYEWKCDSLNQRSKHAALRLGMSFEGTFRQATVYKGRNRDTNWYSILNTEWPTQKAKFQHWLAPENFDSSGKQIKSLQDC